MPLYKNLGRDSGVASYQIQSKSIAVTFSTEVTYVYTYTIPGKEHVETMKTLAQNGRGLNSYINKYVRDKWDHKY